MARARALAAGASASPVRADRGVPATPRPRPARSADLWVSAAAVRQGIGAWAYTRAGGAPHPGDELVRAAVGVACALAECAAESAAGADAPWAEDGAESGGPLTRPVAYEPARLAELAGVTVRDVDRALELLQGAGVVRQSQAGAVPRVALDAGVLAPLPVAARVDWAAVRARLAGAGSVVGAPTAVLRALAERMGAVDVAGVGGGELPLVRASVRDLEDATRFGRSTVSEAVAALVRARVLDADTRAGHTGRFVVRPAAFGLPDEAPAPAVGAPPAPMATSAAHGRSSDRAAAPAGRGVADGHRVATGAPVLVGTFAGTPIYAPAGTPLVVECDAEGRWVCRVGPWLQLGPVAAPS